MNDGASLAGRGARGGTGADPTPIPIPRRERTTPGHATRATWPVADPGVTVPPVPPVTPPAPRRSGGPSPFLAACRSEPHDRVPVWFMRQAGRSLPEYRAVRGEGSILDAIRSPAVAAEITMQPVRRYGVDAAILYSDIVVPVAAVGFGVDVVPGTGPVVERPFATPSDLDRLRPLDPEADTPYVLDTVRAVTAELDVPLIGFAGAPFTVASYLVEGRPSRTYGRTKALMHGNPSLWHALMARLADLAVASLRSQVHAGAAAVQVFDSWAGALSPPDYIRFVLPHSRRVFDGVADLGVPRIHFGVATGELLTLLGEAGADVVGVDWRVPIDVARGRVGPGRALQGNLDPAVCLAPWPAVAEATRDVLARNAGHPGHVFNLGHGVLPETDPTVLERVVELVHEEGTVR
jgi:uroporphyrinogen decarboxylase